MEVHQDHCTANQDLREARKTKPGAVGQPQKNNLLSLFWACVRCCPGGFLNTVRAAVALTMGKVRCCYPQKVRSLINAEMRSVSRTSPPFSHVVAAAAIMKWNDSACGVGSPAGRYLAQCQGRVTVQSFNGDAWGCLASSWLRRWAANYRSWTLQFPASLLFVAHPPQPENPSSSTGPSPCCPPPVSLFVLFVLSSHCL